MLTMNLFFFEMGPKMLSFISKERSSVVVAFEAVEEAIALYLTFLL